MEIKQVSPYFKKKPWKRLVNKDAEMRPIADCQFYDIPTAEPSGLHYQYLGNAELYNESCENAHEVNSDIFSTRPIYEVVTRKIKVQGDNGEEVEKEVKEEVIVGYDQVETVRSGLPKMLLKQHASHLGKNGIEIADETGKDPAAYDTFRAWKDISGIDAEFVNLMYLGGECGDVAIYLYQHGNSIEYTTFAYQKGDMLFPHKDDNGNPFVVRLYQLNGRTAADFYFTDFIETYVQGDITQEKDDENANGIRSWFSRVKGWFRNINIKVTEDGWTRISKSITQLDNTSIQVAYLRFDDSFIGCAMQNIDALDRALSYTSDKMRSTAFSKFLVKATKIKNLPALSSGEEVIGIDGDVESLKASDAHYIAPPDISNIATINIKNIFDAIMQSTMSIDLQPEILKSGADSSQTLKLLLRRQLQWCHVMWPQVRPFAAQIVNILKGLVDKIEKGGGRYSMLKLSVWNTPWLPQDEDALADRITKYIYSGVLSKDSGRQESGMQYSDEARKIAKEQEDELYRKSFIPLKAKADAEEQFGLTSVADDIVIDEDNNPNQPKIDNNKPKIDNNSSRRDIADNEPK